MVLVSDTEQLYGWGCNKFGQLGLDTNSTIIDTPTQIQSIENDRVINIACGSYHTIIVNSQKKVFFLLLHLPKDLKGGIKCTYKKNFN